MKIILLTSAILLASLIGAPAEARRADDNADKNHGDRHYSTQRKGSNHGSYKHRNRNHHGSRHYKSRHYGHRHAQYKRYARYNHHNNYYGHNGGYLLGGMVLGGLINHAYHANTYHHPTAVVHTKEFHTKVVHSPETIVNHRYEYEDSNATSTGNNTSSTQDDGTQELSTRLLKDTEGRCFAISRNEEGKEQLIEVDRSICGN